MAISEQKGNYTTEFPGCFEPEKDTVYPLCIGNGKKQCDYCALFVDLEPEEDE